LVITVIIVRVLRIIMVITVVRVRVRDRVVRIPEVFEYILWLVRLSQVIG
jgi:hypothetical protein